MSACNTCVLPGHCCRTIRLYSGGPYLADSTPLEALVAMAVEGVPFIPWCKPTQGKYAHQHVYWCPNLTLDGRCGDYDNRPATCKVFEPGEADACIHSPTYFRYVQIAYGHKGSTTMNHSNVGFVIVKTSAAHPTLNEFLEHRPSDDAHWKYAGRDGKPYTDADLRRVDECPICHPPGIKCIDNYVNRPVKQR